MKGRERGREGGRESEGESEAPLELSLNTILLFLQHITSIHSSYNTHIHMYSRCIVHNSAVSSSLSPLVFQMFEQALNI